jgi:Holliday junction resolvase RusA-like endonuclease
MKINIKPLSVNQVWQGKRFKTKAYKDYETELLYLLPKVRIPKGKIRMELEYGLSSKNADIDNPTKPLLDILSKKYGFNDKMIYQLNIKKVDVKKGEEYIKIKLTN